MQLLELILVFSLYQLFKDRQFLVSGNANKFKWQSVNIVSAVPFIIKQLQKYYPVRAAIQLNVITKLCYAFVPYFDICTKVSHMHGKFMSVSLTYCVPP